MEDKLVVDLGTRSYDIVMGWGSLPDIGKYLSQHQIIKGRKLLVISNQQVFSLYGEQVLASLISWGYQVDYALVPDGEEAKSLAQTQLLYHKCCELQLDRKSSILALGGGVVGDLAGFVAATYMRGIDFIQLPTTLLSQVDSSVGGKVGINLPAGKNLVGAFYQPKLVYMDLATLNTLDPRELRTGVAEIIKYGVLDAKFFSYLEEELEQLLALEPQVLLRAIRVSCDIKREIVSRDELEHGQRAVLNLGHTIGHGLEAVTNYQQYRHGEAVALGMKYAGKIGLALGIWSDEEQQRLEDLLLRAGLPSQLPQISWEQLLFAMELDKKNSDGQLTMIIPRSLGQVEVIAGIERELVKQAIGL